MDKINVLIFPAGAENALEIYNSLKYNLHLEIYGLSGKADHAKFVYPADRYYEGDYYIDDKDFVVNFNKLINKLNINVIIPTHDTIALYLAKIKDRIDAKIIVSDYETALIAREKRLTYKKFEKELFCPKVYDSIVDCNSFPVILKPNIGEGAKNVVKVETKQKALNILDEYEDMVICEYLPGSEITVDCFTNNKGELLFVGPRTRERVQMGISFHSETIEVTDEIREIALKINNELKFRGAWFFQVKKDTDDKYKLLEVSTRQAGTMAVYRQLGINFALLGIFDALGHNVSILKNNLNITLDRSLRNRYNFDYDFDKVYIDFDDTLIVNNKVNDMLITLIYQCINNNIKVILITRHESSLDETMKKYKISPIMFDEIIHIQNGEKKSDFINPENAIFIDNYFVERKEVLEALGIPVFDVDAVECLIK